MDSITIFERQKRITVIAVLGFAIFAVLASPKEPVQSVSMLDSNEADPYTEYVPRLGRDGLSSLIED